MSDWIWANIGTLATLAVLAVLAAPIQDLAAGLKIQWDNYRRGKPTFVVGTCFALIHLPSGQSYKNAVIERVDFYRVYLRVPVAQPPGLLPQGLVSVPKRTLVSMGSHGQLVMAGGQNNLRGLRGGRKTE